MLHRRDSISRLFSATKYCYKQTCSIQLAYSRVIVCVVDENVENKKHPNWSQTSGCVRSYCCVRRVGQYQNNEIKHNCAGIHVLHLHYKNKVTLSIIVIPE